MPQVNSYPRTVQPVTTYSKMVSPAAEDKSKYRRSLAKRLITRIKHLQNELETEVFIEEQLRISPEEEQMMNEVVGKIDHLFAANNPGGFKVRNPLLGRRYARDKRHSNCLGKLESKNGNIFGHH